MIVVTAATGQLGRLVVEGLLKKVPATELTVAVRNPDKAADLAALGVRVKAADYSDAASLADAFAGADKVLLISGSEVGQRIAQHTAVVTAAKEAGVGHLAYTSVLHADQSTLGLAPEHLATEQVIRESDVPFTLLRNGWYTENYTQTITQGAEHGSFSGSAGEGRIASASRADYADAAVAALTGEGHVGKVYELAGDRSWTYVELAAELTKATGKDVTYRDLPADEHREFLVSAGVPAALAATLADFDRGTAHGDLDDTSGDLRTLIGHATTPLAETVSAILA
jgi:NAD(P)H dehydrogenase (quinone)